MERGCLVWNSKSSDRQRRSPALSIDTAETQRRLEALTQLRWRQAANASREAAERICRAEA